MTQQIRFRELVKDPLYKKWFLTRPALDGQVKTWRVYVQRERGGPWAKRDFPTWAEAVKFSAKVAKSGAWDLALNLPSRATRAPRVKTKRKTAKGLAVREPWRLPPGHKWCDYCRRPTVFKYFRKHHAIPKHIPVIPYERSCTVCGCREGFLQRSR